MTRGKLALTTFAVLAVFITVLVVYLPASWFAAALPREVRCAELGGSIWNWSLTTFRIGCSADDRS